MTYLPSSRILRTVFCVFGLYFLLLGCGPKNLSTQGSYTMANQLYSQEKYDRAAKLYTDFLMQSPQNPLADEVLFRLGKIYQQQKQYQKALLRFGELIQQHPQSRYIPEAQLEAAISSFHLHRYSEAVPLFQKYLSSSHPARDAEAIMLLADSYFALKEYHKAFGEYNLLQVLDPQKKHDPRILYQTSLCQIHSGHPDQALAQLNSLLGTEFGAAHQAEIQQALAQANLMLRHPVQALDNLLKARQYAHNAQEAAQYEQKIAAIIQDQLTRQDLETLAEKWGRNFPADLVLIQLGYAWQEERQLSKAKQVWQQFLISFPDHPRKGAISNGLEELDQKLAAGSTKIGCIVPTTGDFAVYGDKVLKGVKLAIEEYNLHNHTDIQLVPVDSKGNPEYGKNGARLLVEKEHVAAIIGPLLSSEAYALAPVIDKLRVCTITPTAAGKGIPESSPYFFRNCLTNQQQGRAIAQYAVNTLQLRRFGIFHPNNPYGIELMQIFSREVKSLGGTVEIVEPYQEGETDFRPQLERINRIHPDGLFIPGYPEEIILIAPQVPFYNFEEEAPHEQADRTAEAQGAPAAAQTEAAPDQAGKKQAMQLLGCDGWYSEKVISQGGEYVEGAVFTTGFFKESQDPPIQEFINKYQKKYGHPPDILSAQAYDTTNILLLALLSERLTHEGLREALFHTRDFSGVTGVTSFSPSGEAAKKTFILTIKDHRFMCPP